MDFRFDDALPVLRRTPRVFRELPEAWTDATEGAGTEHPYRSRPRF
jgi:hypothetical protein